MKGKKKIPNWNAQFRLLNTSCCSRESIYYNRNSFLFPVVFKFKKKVKIKSTLCFSKIGSTRDSVNILHFKTSTISRGPLFGTIVGLLVHACVRPRWAILCWYCCLPCPGLWAPSLPLWRFPLGPLQGRVLEPLSGASHRVTCTGSMHVSQEYSRRWALGVYSVLFLVNQLLVCFQCHCLYRHSALLPAAINAASADKSNKYLCALWTVLVYFLVSVFLF